MKTVSADIDVAGGPGRRDSGPQWRSCRRSVSSRDAACAPGGGCGGIFVSWGLVNGQIFQEDSVPSYHCPFPPVIATESVAAGRIRNTPCSGTVGSLGRIGEEHDQNVFQRAAVDAHGALDLGQIGAATASGEVGYCQQGDCRTQARCQAVCDGWNTRRSAVRRRAKAFQCKISVSKADRSSLPPPGRRVCSGPGGSSTAVHR